MKKNFFKNKYLTFTVALLIIAIYCISGYSYVYRSVYVSSSYKLCGIDFISFSVCNKAFAGITAPLVSCIFLIIRKNNLYSVNYVIRSISRQHIANRFIIDALVFSVMWAVLSVTITGILGYAVTGSLCNYDLLNSHYYYYTGRIVNERTGYFILIKTVIHTILVIYSRIMLCVGLMSLIRKNWMIFTGTAIMLFIMPHSLFITGGGNIERIENQYAFYSYSSSFISEASLLIVVCVVMCLLSRLFIRKWDFYEEKQ